MELRVHGIGGPTANSVLGLPPGTTCRAVWRTDLRAGSAVRMAPGGRAVAVYHWAPLTSGSRWFALWPLLLPFTVINVAGFMAPGGRVRGPLTQRLVKAIALAATVTWVGWSTLAGQLVLGKDGDAWQGSVLGVALALAPFAVSQFTRRAFERFAVPAPTSGSAREHASTSDGLASAGFFDGEDHRSAMWLHGVAGCGALWWVFARGDGDDAIVTAAGDLVVGATVTAAALLVALMALSFQRGRRWWSGSPMAAAAGMGVLLLGGLTSAAIQWSVGSCPSNPAVENPSDACRLLQGKPWMLVDLFGWALLVGLGAATAVIVRTVWRPRADEDRTAIQRLLPTGMARLRARLARLPARLAAVAGAAVVTFLMAAAAVLPARAWPVETSKLCDDLPARLGDSAPCLRAERRLSPAGEAEPWVMTDTPPVTIARWAFLALLGFVGLNLVKSRASPDVLRRVGSIWDVLSFWPRSNHPLAVRPYGERAVPELQTLLADRPDVLGDDELIVTAHSQGAVLVAAALASRPAAGPFRLLTMGAPLRTLHAQAFPRFVCDELFAKVRAAAGGDDRWKNVFRLTDHVGRSVFVDDDPWDGGSGDRPLVDPPTTGAPVQGHNAYWEDPAVMQIVRGWRTEAHARRTDA